MSERNRPFRILGLQQVAIGGADLELLKRLWVDLLGAKVKATKTLEQENVIETIASFDDGQEGVEIDLMQPLDPQRKPRVDQPPLNHIGLWVDDLKAAYAWLSQQGVRFAPGGIRRGAAGYEVCFIHPKADATHALSGEGVLIELVQYPTSNPPG